MAASPRLAGPLAAALLAGLAGAARAEVGVSLSAASDDRFQGVSLSDGHPVLSASLAYDRPGGVYAGATLVAVFARHSGLQPLGYVVYIGYSRRLSPDLTWDAGVTNSGVTQLLDKRYADDYSELYVGLTKGALSGHVYFSPSYLGERSSALYFELSGALRLAPRWRLFGHAGALAELEDHHDADGSRLRADARVGLAREFKNFELRASVSATGPTSPAGYRQPRQSAVVEAVAFF